MAWTDCIYYIRCTGWLGWLDCTRLWRLNGLCSMDGLWGWDVLNALDGLHLHHLSNDMLQPEWESPIPPAPHTTLPWDSTMLELAPVPGNSKTSLWQLDIVVATHRTNPYPHTYALGQHEAPWLSVKCLDVPERAYEEVCPLDMSAAQVLLIICKVLPLCFHLEKKME